MGPGLAGSTTKVYGGGVNVNQVQYGNKLQGLPPVTGNRRPYKIYKSKAGGNEPGRSRVFCINQLGGIGMANKNSQFAPNADGVGDCHPWKPKLSQTPVGIFIPPVTIGPPDINPSPPTSPDPLPDPDDGGGDGEVSPEPSPGLPDDPVEPLPPSGGDEGDEDVTPLPPGGDVDGGVDGGVGGIGSLSASIDAGAPGYDFLTAIINNDEEMAKDMAIPLINLLLHETGLHLQALTSSHYTMTHALEGQAAPVFTVNESGVITAIDINGDGDPDVTENGIQDGEAAIETVTEPAPIEAETEPAPIEAETEPAPIETVTEPAPIEAETEPAPESQPQTLTMDE
ncbi:MAG: hypothetical protein ACXABD_00460 [Candidatus Thorarchaeota archaeon]|jgi:hypothetical protein